MATPQEAQQEIMDALYDHFDRSGESLTPAQIAEMTALDEPTVQNALRVLYNAGRIEGIPVEEFDYPLEVTNVAYQ
jgi:predicted transcriptional regulator